MRAAVLVVLGSVFTVAVAAVPARAAVNLVQNGDFETTTLTSSDQLSTTNVSNWSSTGYNFIFFPGQADTTGAGGGHLKLWGPNDGGVVNPGGASQNLGVSPTGGNFLAADGAYGVQKISQTINGLQAGTNYLVSFEWAAAQQLSFNGTTTENWTVSLGAQSFTTPTVTNPNHGFTPWTQASFVFTATAGSELLSFLATGTPDGQPPFSLLDGVTLYAAPEPATWALMMAGIAGIALFGRQSRGRQSRVRQSRVRQSRGPQSRGPQSRGPQSRGRQERV